MEINKEELVAAIHIAFAENRVIDTELHMEHHQFLKAWIAREKRKQERYEIVKTQVYGWGAIAVLSGILASMGKVAYHLFFEQGGG